MKTCRRALCAAVVLAVGAGVVPLFASAQTPECKQTIAALEKAQATLIYWDELPDPEVPGSQYQYKHINRTFPCRGVREVKFIAGDERDAMTLAALPHLLKLEEPEQITLIIHRFTASRFDALAKHAQTLNELKAVHLAGDHDKPASDADLIPLAKIENLELLALPSIQRTNVTDEGLAHLSSNKRLKSLIIDNSRTTDEGLSHLKDLPTLEYLSANATELTGAGLKHLDRSSIKYLKLVESEVSDRELEQIGRLQELEILSLAGCPLDGSGLSHLTGLHKLESLALSRTKVDDASLKALVRLPKLRELSLNSCPITDAGVDSLKQLRGLKRLSIGDTKISKAGREELQKALPDTKID